MHAFSFAKCRQMPGVPIVSSGRCQQVCVDGCRMLPDPGREFADFRSPAATRGSGKKGVAIKQLYISDHDGDA
jgi:hypothetical protein